MNRLCRMKQSVVLNGKTGGRELNEAVKKRIWWIAGVAAALLLMAGGIALARSGGKSPIVPPRTQATGNKTGGTDSESPLTDAGSGGVQAGATTSEGVVSSGGTGASGGVPTPRTSTNSGTKQSTSPTTNPGTKNPTSTPTTPVTKTMTVKILWWNDTQSRKPVGTIISIGDARWKPDVTALQDSGTLAGLPFGKQLTIVVYPDGPLGKKVSVPVMFDEKTMKPNSDQDAIHVEIRDTAVKVLGNPVNNFEVITPR